MNFKKSFLQSLKNLKNIFPILIGMLLLVSLLNNLLADLYKEIFTWNIIYDPLIWAFAGSISFGMPATSYIIWWELQEAWINMIAITAFILAWTTVWIAMLPLEASFLWKKFAIYRNILNFIFAIIIAILTTFTVNLF